MHQKHKKMFRDAKLNPSRCKRSYKKQTNCIVHIHMPKSTNYLPLCNCSPWQKLCSAGLRGRKNLCTEGHIILLFQLGFWLDWTGADLNGDHSAINSSLFPISYQVDSDPLQYPIQFTGQSTTVLIHTGLLISYRVEIQVRIALYS